MCVCEYRLGLALDIAVDRSEICDDGDACVVVRKIVVNVNDREQAYSWRLLHMSNTISMYDGEVEDEDVTDYSTLIHKMEMSALVLACSKATTHTAR